MRKSVFIDRKIPHLGLKLLKDAGIEYEQWNEDRELSQEEFIDYAKKHQAVLTAGSTALDKEMLGHCQHIKVIALLSVGFDRVDIKAANSLKIPIGNTPGVLSEATADTAFLLMLATSRKAIYLYNKITQGKWGFSQPIDDLGISIKGKTLGIFGLGSIGFELAKKAQNAFGMRIIYHNRSHNAEAEEQLGARKVTFEELLSESDVLAIFSALTDETRGRFNYDAFSKMKKNALFINAARGAIHNEADLIRALENDVIWGAGLDVTNPEPMKADNPLLRMPNVTVLPHIGSATVQTRDEMARLAVENIIAGLNGERLPYLVNADAYA